MKLHTPFADVVPRLSPAAYLELKSDIEANGLMKSILVDEDNNVLDGHHRERACTELGIDIRTEVCSDIGDMDAKRMRIITLNLAERELSKMDRKRLDANRKTIALKKLKDGMGVREVARLVGKPHTTILNWRDSANGQSDQPSQPPETTLKQVANTMDIEPKTDVNRLDEGKQDIALQKKKALSLSASGMRVSDIASALGRNTNTVKKWIADPESAPSNRGYGVKRQQIDDREVERLFNDGKSREEIQGELGFSKGAVVESFKRLGIGRAGQEAKNPLMKHISQADAAALAWEAGTELLIATAKCSSPSQVRELVSALGRLSRETGKLKNRLNKEVERKDGDE